MFFSALGIGFLVWLMGGFLTPIAGRWRDGDREIVLTQLGPWVRGVSHPESGESLYRGTARFGRLRLARYDSGFEHLKKMGFPDDVIPLMSSQVMGRFNLKLEGDQLRGTFEGCRFQFSQHPLKISAVIRLEPTERTWVSIRKI